MTDEVIDMDEDLYDEDSETTVADRSSAIQSGWNAVSSAAASDKKYTNEFRFGETPKLIKFLSNEPFAVFHQHWIERAGKKSFVCLNDGCPLCGIGDSPSQKVAFSVVNLTDEEHPVEILLTSVTLSRQLASLNSDPKTGPLDRLYWSVSRQGKRQTTTYSIIPVKARDLAEDYGLDAAKIEAELDNLKPLSRDVISLTPRAKMVEIANEVANSK